LMQLKEIQVGLSQAQYHAMMEVQAALQFLELSRSCTKPNPKCSLYWCLIAFIDWRYSQTCWYL
jgi:hypothetical protein